MNPNKTLFKSLAVKESIKEPVTVKLTALEKFLPDESICITYFSVLSTVAYFGSVHFNTKAVFNESVAVAAIFVTEALKTGAEPLTA